MARSATLLSPHSFLDTSSFCGLRHLRCPAIAWVTRRKCDAVGKGNSFRSQTPARGMRSRDRAGPSVADMQQPVVNFIVKNLRDDLTREAWPEKNARTGGVNWFELKRRRLSCELQFYIRAFDRHVHLAPSSRLLVSKSYTALLASPSH